MIRYRAIELALIAAAFVVSPASARDYRLGELRIADPWARATPGKARTGAAYVTISNRGETVDKVIALSTPAARKAELHAHQMQDNVMRMRRVGALEVRPGEPSIMRPGGLHIMLKGLRGPLRRGGSFDLTLTFERAGAVTVQVEVLGIGAMGPSHGGS